MIKHLKIMKLFIKLGWVIFVASCSINTRLQNSFQYDCDIIYGQESDWNTISDDLARNIYEHNLNCEKKFVNH